eukprot:SAG25_NODE_87_length_16363_cov_40.489179_16_plen_194_part_00
MARGSSIDRSSHRTRLLRFYYAPAAALVLPLRATRRAIISQGSYPCQVMLSAAFAGAAIMSVAASAAATGGGPCAGTAASSSASWCNHSLPIADRVEALIAAMTLPEKANLVSSFSHSVPRLNWPAHRWGNEALHGVLGAGFTSWPSPIGVAASFNRSLFRALGRLTSDEARAGEMTGSTYWAPNINIFRDPS